MQAYDGDVWRETDVPLGEMTESYIVEVRQSGNVIRQEFMSMPVWNYSASEKSTDLTSGSYEIAVAQVSDRYGIGPFRTITLTH